jgi:hypothetical protein
MTVQNMDETGGPAAGGIVQTAFLACRQTEEGRDAQIFYVKIYEMILDRPLQRVAWRCIERIEDRRFPRCRIELVFGAIHSSRPNIGACRTPLLHWRSPIFLAALEGTNRLAFASLCLSWHELVYSLRRIGGY